LLLESERCLATRDVGVLGEGEGGCEEQHR